MKLSNRKTGFTLIELLVVIAIIGILASVVLSSLNSARASARDAARVSIFKNIQTALEIYRNANGSYPGSNTHYVSSDCSYSNAPWTSIFNAAFDTYMDVPARDSGGRCMVYSKSKGTGWRCYPQASGIANEINPNDYEYFLVMPIDSSVSYTSFPRFNSDTSMRCVLGPRL